MLKKQDNLYLKKKEFSNFEMHSTVEKVLFKYIGYSYLHNRYMLICIGRPSKSDVNSYNKASDICNSKSDKTNTKKFYVYRYVWFVCVFGYYS